MVTVLCDDYAALKKRAEEQALKELKEEGFGEDSVSVFSQASERQGKSITSSLPQKIKKEGEKNEERRTEEVSE